MFPLQMMPSLSLTKIPFRNSLSLFPQGRAAAASAGTNCLQLLQLQVTASPRYGVSPLFQHQQAGKLRRSSSLITAPSPSPHFLPLHHHHSDSFTSSRKSHHLRHRAPFLPRNYQLTTQFYSTAADHSNHFQSQQQETNQKDQNANSPPHLRPPQDHPHHYHPRLTMQQIQDGIKYYLSRWRQAEDNTPTYNSFLLKNVSFQGIKPESITQDSFTALFDFPITQEYVNLYGTLHGGVIASLVDVISTIPISVTDRTHRGGVSTDIHVSYLNGGILGHTVQIEAQCTKVGKYMAFSHTTLRDKETGKVIATGSHTKFLAVKKKFLDSDGVKKDEETLKAKL